MRVLLILGTIIAFSALLMMFVSIEKTTEVVPCVDGNNNVNLEGFMCEDVKASNPIIFDILFFIGVLIVIIDFGINWRLK